MALENRCLARFPLDHASRPVHRQQPTARPRIVLVATERAALTILSASGPAGATTDSVDASARSSVQGPDHRSGSVAAGGCIHRAFYNYTAVGATSRASIHDDIVLPSTPTWSGQGFLSLGDHVTRAASVSDDHVQHDSTDVYNHAESGAAVRCESRFGLGPCTATGPTPGGPGLSTDTPDGPYDKILTSLLPGKADTAGHCDVDSSHIAAVGEPPPATGRLSEPAPFALPGPARPTLGFTRRKSARPAGFDSVKGGAITASSTRHLTSWLQRAALAFLAGLAVLVASAPAQAAPLIYALSSVCEEDISNCASGGGAVWTPPNGALVSSSVSRAWSNTLSPGDTFSLSAAAQSSVKGPNHWSGSVSATGYINHSFYGFNFVSATSEAFIQDDVLLPSTPNWQGYGYFALSYHITGGSSAAFSFSDSAGLYYDPRNSASATLQFKCGSTVGVCLTSDVTYIDPGIYRDTLGPTYDKTVTIFVPVESDVSIPYDIDSQLTAIESLYGNQGSTHISGGASADFSHTFQLVDADLLDGSMNPVADWSVTSSSGFDYAHIAAVVEPPPVTNQVPEPSTFALLGLVGVAAFVARWSRRRAAVGPWMSSFRFGSALEPRGMFA